jgi:deazaflavin-dependent oxidoreductase (nitroreductase family)
MVSRRAQLFFTGAHTWVYRATGGRLGSRLGSVEQILLTTTGRTSGKPRTTPLTAIPDGKNLVLVASDGGKPQHPQWYRNLLADDLVTIQRGPSARRMRARPADEAERRRLWPKAVGVYKGYAQYQQRTDRQIPLVICEPY